MNNKGTTLFLGVEGRTTSDGKHMMTWEFRNEITKNAIKVKVLYHNKNGKMFFVADIKDYKVSLENSDINALKVAVDEYLSNKTNEANNIVWEDWLKIEVELPYKPSKYLFYEGMSVTVSVIPKGKVKGSQKEYTMNSNNVLVDFPTSLKKDEVDGLQFGSVNGLKLGGEGLDPKNSKMMVTDENKIRSFIRDTEENRAAIEKLIIGIKKAREAIESYTDRDSIEKYTQALLNLNDNVFKLENKE